MPCLRGVLTAALVSVALAPHGARAQSTGGVLEGVVTAGADQPLTSAEIAVTGAELPRGRTTRSDSRGYFRLAGMPVGRYAVSIRLPGYRPVLYDSVVVQLGQTTTLSQILLAMGEATLAPLVVSGERAAIDVASASTGMVLSAATIRALPQERDIGSVLAMLPQHNESPYGDGINVAGSTGYENAHFIDGAHTTDPLLGRGSSAIPYNFVREIQVKTGGYEAEFGRSIGGIVNVLTHSGGESLRMESYGYYTNNRFSGERLVGALERASTGFSYYDFGVTAGGPILRERANFFLAFNPTFSVEHIRVPSFAPQLDRRRQNLFAGKVTWLPSAASTVLLTVYGDPSTHERVAPGIEFTGSPDSLLNLDPVLGRLRQGGTTVSLSASHSAGDAVQLQLSLQRGAWRNRNVARGAPGLLVTDQNGTWSGAYGITINERMQRNSGAFAATLTRSSHVMKAGTEVEENVLDEFFAYGIPSGTGGIRDESPDGFVLVNGGTVGRVSTRSMTGFVQDGWTMREGLRLNAGVRWDGEFFVDPAGRTSQRLTHGWQPRVGVVLDPGRRGREKYFATAGRFYQQLGTALASYQFGGTSTLVTSHASASVDTVYRLDGGRIPGASNLRGEHFDEFTLGYERLTASGIRIGVRGIQRQLREIVEDAFVGDSVLVGNPGRGELAFLPRPRREYLALEFTVDRLGHERFEYAVSYVLSRNHGNYPGVFDSDNGAELAANMAPQFDDSLQLRNATGFLPNDRRHVFKLFGAWRPARPLSVGTTMVWQSGTPLSEYELLYAGHYGFLSPRDSAGRTPTVFELNLRLTWEAVRPPSSRVRLIADVFHVASQRSATQFDQVKIRQGTLSSSYGNPIRYQSPMTMRLGVTLGG